MPAELYVFGFHEIDKTNTLIAGGKGVNLGELSLIEEIRVPEGFCISTEAFKRIMEESPSINNLLDKLSLLKQEDREKISALGREIRQAIESIAIPAQITEEIYTWLTVLGENTAYAVRSSATAEDLPTASFAGQQDTYLNIIGKDAILQHTSKCWASLFTDRAVIYRIQNGFDHRQVYLSVIIQRMVFPQAAGIVFTADPVNGNRKVISIDAGFGLGEALVCGLVNPDVYKVRNGTLIDKKISAKKIAIYALQDGGTKEQQIEPEQQDRQVLADEQILQLEQIARKIEAHFGQPQDIEWCRANDTFYIVQSRPITTLFPVPAVSDHENHVYVSVGHQQMMTDPIKPLGLSVWNLTAARPMFTAGGRLFVDVTTSLASPDTRENILNVLGQSDPRIKEALITVLDRGDFIKSIPGPAKEQSHIKSYKGMTAADIRAQAGNDPSIVTELITTREKSILELKEKIGGKSGTELFDLIAEDIRQSRTRLFESKNLGVIMAGVNAAMWINDKMNEWLGEKSVADTLTQSVSNNVTSEMGLALLDVADVIRPYPEVIEYLSHLYHGGIKEDNFLDGLARFRGGQQARQAIDDFLNKYGMRCAGEIDITKTRWSEKPATLVPLILSNIKNFEPGAGKRKFEQGLQEAMKKQQELLSRLKQLPDGEQKAQETKQMIDLVRSLAGYREYPKYAQVRRYFVYKQALLKEIEKLVQSGVIREKEDAYYLSFEELQELVSTHKPDYQVINKRKEDYKLYEKLFPPRVMTSDGEIITGTYKRENIPAGALIGLPVSSGVVEGRARIILKMEDAELGEEDILVTTFTDPSWTPLFVSIKGLVTEVGGVMTHGAVIAREYGLPAVVGVENAASLIKDGQRIRVHGTEGYIEIL